MAPCPTLAAAAVLHHPCLTTSPTCVQGSAKEILDVQDTSGKAAIHWAACQNLGACIKELHRHGASV